MKRKAATRIVRSGVAAVALLAGACVERDPAPHPGSTVSDRDTADAVTRDFPFEDVTAASGLDFVHSSGFGGKRYIVEIVAGGAGFFDYDLDGDLDIYFVNGAYLPGLEVPSPAPRNRLYANDGTGRFTDVTEAAGVGDEGYGIGLAIGDIDNDGDPDLYVTNYGPNRLYRNRGDGTFEEIGAAAGVADPLFSCSATFFDLDLDGDLDLYVTNYLDFDPRTFSPCVKHGVEVYCGPDSYNPIPDRLYRNDGAGRFEDVTAELGISERPGKGLGVVAGDLDGDGDQDLYVANDGTANHLYINQLRQGRPGFLEEGIFYGVAFGESARAEAGMGTDLGDFDGDGDLDIIVTNLDAQSNALYRNDGGEAASESSFRVGLGATTVPYVGFGVRFLDFDHDGDLDLFACNGHVMDNIARIRQGATYAQRDLLFENLGGRFSEILASLEEDYPFPLRVGRALATADIDGDGDLDVLIANNNEPPLLLKNVIGQDHPTVGLELVGAAPASNRDAYGARVTARLKDRALVREVRAGASYLASNDPRILIGVPEGTEELQIDIRWPSGRRESCMVRPGAYHRILESRGVRQRIPFREQ